MGRVAEGRSQVEGEGAYQTIMVQMKRTHERGQEDLESNSLKEGSKEKKDMTDEEKERLKTFASTFAGAWSDSTFLRDALSRSKKPKAPEASDKAEDDTQNKKSNLSAGLAGPSAHIRHMEFIASLGKHFDAASKAANTAVEDFDTMNEKAKESSKELPCYVKQCKVRVHQAMFACARHNLAPDMPIPGADIKDVIVVPPTPADSPTKAARGAEDLVPLPGTPGAHPAKAG